ncbi:thyroid hormone receptor-associated protein 3 isoform X2 [Denticeps clupeoides]|uniref:thyroid hormone receptor-associated protein 3 isoform X2 n=1 Tax=Denticeps clupeoides TaxID=299321 RepID=UPI0010A32E45|nr:thyroid hormone receptor-associated protein 3-like isoform X2 [Denticeps clupeoides]
MQKSASRSRSRSGSGSRSRSFSRSRSRSRKRRYSSRSRSRSRSHSPSNVRERNYPREYQNNRDFRGFHRGSRRPFFRGGRGRGFFPRGRFQRGRGGYNNNFRPNNWQNYRQHPQQLHQPHQQHHHHHQQQQQQQPPHNFSPKRGRSRSRTPKKRSHSYSDDSSSRRSRRGSSSSSSSRSLKRKSKPRSAKRRSKDVKKDRSASKEAHRERGAAVDEEQAAKPETPGEAGAGDRSSGGWQEVTDLSFSPVKSSPQVRSAVSVDQGPLSTGEASASPKDPAASCNDVSSKSPRKKSPLSVFTGTGVFSKESQADKEEAVPSDFMKFLEEKRMKQVSQWQNGKEKDPTGASTVGTEQANAKSSGGICDKGSATKAADINGKGLKERYSSEDQDGSSRFLKAPPFHGRGEEDKEEEEMERPCPKLRGAEVKPGKSRRKGRSSLSARELFELAYFHASSGGGDDDDDDDDLEALEEKLFASRKQERAAALAAALVKREMASKLRSMSPDKGSKDRRQATEMSPPLRSTENRERGTFTVSRDKSPPKSSAKRGTEFRVRLDSFEDEFDSTSGNFASERKLSRDLLHSGKKEQEFRSIFEHITATQRRRSPSELFAQHIVDIVHHIKAQHFPSSGMTLNERFAIYQRRAAQKEIMKPRKSPEIHRRIDVSPSALKKHSYLFEEMKDTDDSSYKAEGKKIKGYSVDLRRDIEQRKKYLSSERDHKRNPERDESVGSSRERSTDASSHHKKSKEGDYPQEDAEPKQEAFNKGRLGPREHGVNMERGRGRGNFQFRIRGRGWNRGNYQNSANGNGPNVGLPAHINNEDWDPEYTPKSKTYYLHDDRDGDKDKKATEPRVRGRGTFVRSGGRFLFRKAPVIGTTNNASPKWTHDKFQGSAEEGELQDDDSEEDHKEDNGSGLVAADDQ